MPANKYLSRTVFVICLLLLAAVGPLAAATASESDRLRSSNEQWNSCKNATRYSRRKSAA